MRRVLTQRSVGELAYDPTGPSHQIRWDTKVVGLGLRVYPSGKRSYLISYWHDGRKRRMVLGSASHLTLKQARDRAKIELARVTKRQDPLDKKRKKNFRRFGDFAEEYIKHVRKKGNKAWRSKERMIERFLGHWAARDIRTITRAEIAQLHHRVGTDQGSRKGTPYLANRLVQLLSHMFEMAVVIAGYPEKRVNPAQRIERFKEISRARRVELEELPKLVAAIEADENKVAGFLFKFILLTGLRRSEALTAQWKWLDWTRQKLRIPDTKSGRPHETPLSGPAMELLRSIPRRRGNPYIFQSADGAGYLVNPDKAWRRIRKEAGMPDLRIHDLRRSVGSWMAQENVSLHIIAGVLNHRNLNTTKVYARLGDRAPADALEGHGKRFLQVIEGGKQ